MTQDQIISFILQLILTSVFGFIAKSIDRTVKQLKVDILENKHRIEKTEEKQSQQMEKMRQEFAALKSDLPLVYTLREDYIRVQQSQEKQINTLIDKVDKIAERIAENGRH